MTATLAGATGLTGTFLLEELLQDPFFDTVRILIRRPVERTHPRLEKKLVDFNDGDSLLVAISNSDVLFCTVGTTQRKVKGDRAAYRKVDFDIPVNLARYAKMTGCETLILVSSVGASSTSRSFYLKLKGEMEESVIKAGLRSVYIFQPSMLLGDRSESRPLEHAGQLLMKLFSPLIPAKYKPVRARDVAMAMVSLSKQPEPGVWIIDNKKIKFIADSK